MTSVDRVLCPGRNSATVTPKAIKKGLECCAADGYCSPCPYRKNKATCMQLLDTDALVYIEQLETKEVEAQYVSTCPRCSAVIDGDPRYCPHCGQRVQRIVVGG